VLCAWATGIFFEGSVAVRVRTPLSNTREMIHGGDGSQIASLLDNAALPKPLPPAFKVAIEVAEDTDDDGGEDDQERFRRRMI
jgi:hypothetical protein